jgi:nucleotide-binding universal stress UspA family protein
VPRLDGYHLHMALFRSILCAVDLSDHASRVIYHAAGLVGATGARLTILHVRGNRSRTECEMEVQRAFLAAVPYGATYLTDTAIEIESGDPAEVIDRVADERAVDLIVCGTRARSGFARMILGSTIDGLLQRVDRPILLVAQNDWDVVTLGIDRVGLNFGAVIAALDINETEHVEVHLASELAALSNQKLLVMTVAQDGRTDREVVNDMRTRVRGLEPAPPYAFIVRRGEVAQEIARCAVAEGAGLVVMGLAKADGHRVPGRVAIEVLQTGRAHVIAVPA